VSKVWLARRLGSVCAFMSYYRIVFRRVSESCLTQFQVSSFTATSMREQATLRWDDDASFVLDQNADLDFDSELYDACIWLP
jgi:hypothetical protein